MKVFKNLFGNGSKINASEVAYKEKNGTNQILAETAQLGIANDIADYGGTLDPNDPQESLMLTDHKNCPPGGEFWFVNTLFYRDRELASSKTQVATGYKHTKIAVRNCIDGRWGTWDIKK